MGKANESNGAPSGAGGRRGRSPYELMKQAILVGDLVPGELLVETALAREHGVSRTPVREALTRLEQDGLVRRSGRGLVVRERSPEEILDIYEVRIVLEAAAAREATRRRSRIDLISLNRQCDTLEQLKNPDENVMATGNRDFHRAVWHATHNEPLIDLLDRLDLHLARYPATTLSQPGRWPEANKEHRRLVEAIEKQDGAEAERIATEHFERARDLRLVIWANTNEG